MQKLDIANYSVTERLRGGRSVTIRAIRPEDKGPVAGVLKKLSSESFYRRTFSSKRELDDAELTKMADVDFENVVALVAIMNEGDQDKIVGGGRYIRASGAATSAEMAFLIDDAHQGIGIGSRIFRHLITIARAMGITQFEAEVLPSNEGMMRLFERSGLPVVRKPSRDSVHVTIQLHAAGTPGAGGLAGRPLDRGGTH
jgi:RimJ/RimL family protein N-acetyltransferase